MKLLLDTHCWLWAMQRPSKLNPKVRGWIEDPAVTVYLSAASVWEISIKVKLGKLKLPADVETYVATRLKEEQFTELPISLRHAARVGALPHHHRDPFDRLLVAQAQCDHLPLVTADRQLKAYDIKLIRAD